ncbi:unnamed protein product [Cuscuta epithymum]|uniref:RNase H type-1 domain-containing protein n=1 Tax=Cuscuta epithymum TaxID=186058 RepID=A0AAV0F422_9ASTE|nr:unnamed protein product [Cuscuta epithymum]
MSNAKSYVEAWLEVRNQRGGAAAVGRSQGTHLWKLPGAGWRKLNTDAPRRSLGSGLGWAVHNDEGNFVTGGAGPGRGCYSPLEAELLSIREALSWIKSQDWEYLEVESDSQLLAISEILNSSSAAAAGLLAEDIRDISRCFSSITFSFVKR